MKLKKIQKILVASHDAGEANILASLVRKYRCYFHWSIYACGPARNIFERNRLKSYFLETPGLNKKNGNAGKVLDRVNPELLLTGSGWNVDFYLDFIRAARKRKIKTACFLDHWSYYRERFDCPGKEWKENLPDFIFVGDKDAYRLALEKGFPEDKLIQVENPYFENIMHKAGMITVGAKKDSSGSKRRLRILCLSEPFSIAASKMQHKLYCRGYTEYDFLKDLLKVTTALNKSIDLKLKVRLHPSEDINKYSKLLNNGGYDAAARYMLISDPGKNELIDDCSWADVLIGLDSMALLAGLMLGKKSISYMPAKARIPYFLPQQDIERVRSMPGLKHLLLKISKDKKRFNKTCLDFMQPKNYFLNKAQEILK